MISYLEKLTRHLKNPFVLFFIIVFLVPVNYTFFSNINSDQTQSSTDSGTLGLNSPLNSLIKVSNASVHNPQKQETAVEHAIKHSNPKFICPMHADIISEDPDATCPICGMDLVLLEETGEAGIVQLNPEIIKALGVRTEEVLRKTVYQRINSVGYVTYDENKIRRISLRTEAWIEKLFVKTVGEKVQQGDLLFKVYSPKLVNVQEEYLQALELHNNDTRSLVASEDRLIALGVSKLQIIRLRDSRMVDQLINVYAPQNGVVIDLNFREGEFVPPSTSVIGLADLSSIWLMADIFESQIGWVKNGQRVEAKLAFMPDKTLEGMVDYVYPSVDQKTRSLKARLIFDNRNGLLKPNMYASVTIFAKPRKDVLTIPREAVIRTGTQSRVIVALGEGRYKPFIVQTGIETDSKIEIMGGLDEGQHVVVSNQFLIDSESSMRATISKLSGG